MLITHSIQTRQNSRVLAKKMNKILVDKNIHCAKVASTDTRALTSRWGLKLSFKSGTLSLNK